MKIAFFDVAKEEEVIFTSYFNDLQIIFIEGSLHIDNVIEAKEAEIISVFINSSITKEMIDQMPNLKFIATRSTGFDHIDLEYCKQKGIKVSNVPAYGSKTVAEFAFALILSLSRKVFTAVKHLKEENDFSIFNLQGFDLNEKTLGVIGTGKIGKNTIRIAKGFGMKVFAYDLHPDLEFAGQLGFEYKNLDEVLSLVDVLTLHAPYTKENHHMLNMENIKNLKRGVILVNTARGELIDTDALIFGLKEGIIAGAGLDVLEGERELKEEMDILSSKDKIARVKDFKTLLEDHALIEMPNVIVTPHIAFYSKEAEAEIIKTTEQNIKGFLSGNPQNIIN